MITLYILVNLDNRYTRFVKSFSLINKDSINIHINFQDQKKISALLNKLNQNEIIIPNIKEYNFEAKIEYKDEMLETNFRLKGDTYSHYDDWNKLSLKFDFKDDYKLFGMEKFSIQDPWERSFLNEWVFYNLCKEFNLISPRYFFLKIYFNGENKGIFNLEENFSKEMIEHNRRRESVIIRFSEERDILSKILYNNHVNTLDSDKIIEFHESKNILKSDILKKEFEYANYNLNAYFENKLELEDVFDIRQWSSFLSIIELTSAYHALKYGNLRLYYNPVTMLIEPIAYDAEINEDLLTGKNYFNNLDFDYWQIPFFIRDMLKNDKFYKSYISQLRKLIDENYLNEFFEKNNDFIDNQIKIINSDFNYSFYNMEFVKHFLKRNKNIKNILNNDNEIYSYLYDNKLYLKNNSNHHLQIYKINNLKLSDKNSVIIYKNNTLMVPLKSNLEINNLEINYSILGDSKELNKEIYLTEKSTKKRNNFYDIEVKNSNSLDKNLLIENNELFSNNLVVQEGETLEIQKGSKIFLSNGANIYIFGNLNINGTKDKPVVIECESDCWFYANYADLNINYTEFINFNEPKKFAPSVTGAITINRSSLNLRNSEITADNSEDSINIFDSNFYISDLKIFDAANDSVDIDFSDGAIKNLYIFNSGNDGIDFSNSTVDIENIVINDAKDKCISIGEESTVKIISMSINNCYIGIAIKDSSKLEINGNLNSNANEYDIATYIKKNIFGSSEIKINTSNLPKLNILSEEGSELFINGDKFKNNSLNTYNQLY